MEPPGTDIQDKYEIDDLRTKPDELNKINADSNEDDDKDGIERLISSDFERKATVVTRKVKPNIIEKQESHLSEDDEDSPI